MTDINTAVSTIVECLASHVADPSSRASGSYWIDSTWIDERLKKYRWPQMSVFHVASASEEARQGYLVYYPTIQIDIFATGENQKQDVSDEVKDTLLKYRDTLQNSGVGIDRLLGEFDVIDDERVPLKTYRKTLTYRTVIWTSGN